MIGNTVKLLMEMFAHRFTVYLFYVPRAPPPPPVLPNCQSAKWRSSGIVGKRVLYRGFVTRGRKRGEESWIRKKARRKRGWGEIEKGVKVNKAQRKTGEDE